MAKTMNDFPYTDHSHIFEVKYPADCSPELKHSNCVRMNVSVSPQKLIKPFNGTFGTAVMPFSPSPFSLWH